ncbi:NUDIX domain-containing protein [Actinoplanes sp. NPDC051859]|uniref:NUDIX domain-containing protein n=1 Tax=Actinoplanes sp. NPDC051859 TaxID=3363909 RepID=UPI00378C0E95
MLPDAEYFATLPRKRMAAGVLLSDDRGRTLLVEPSYKDDWEIPGGTIEADESPYSAAQRELEEELGLSIKPGRLLVTDWVSPRPGRTEGLMLVFDGGLLTPPQTAVIQLQTEELRSWAWCTEPEANERLSDLLARRVAAAIRARADDTAVYLEVGYLCA